METPKFNNTDSVIFAGMMHLLGIQHGKVVDADTIRAYEVALADCDINDLMRKAQQHTRESKWFPRPSELRPAGANYRRKFDAISRRNQRTFAKGEQTKLEWQRNPPPKRLGFQPIADILDEVPF